MDSTSTYLDAIFLSPPWVIFEHTYPHCAEQFLTKNRMTLMLHPLYMPNLSLNNLFSFVSLDEKSPQGGNVLPMWKK